MSATNDLYSPRDDHSICIAQPVARRLSISKALGGVAVAALCITGASNTAQGQQDAVIADEELEEIVVTGSRISRPAFDNPAPATVLSAEAIRQSGETDISKLLTETPALIGSFTATSSSNVGFDSDLTDDTSVGRADLRSLGPNRTLVLVNGRRHVGSIQGDGAVDLNSIPISLIDRTEVVTGGSSAVYGADAVTGVLNFVLRDDVEGLEYQAQYSVSDNGDADNYFAAITAGSAFANERGHAILNFEYTRQTPLRANQRNRVWGTEPFSQVANSDALAETFGYNPAAANVYVPDFRINFSSAAGILAVREAGSNGSVSGGLVDGNEDAGIIAGVPALQIFSNGTFREFDRGIESSPFEASGGDGIPGRNPNAFIVGKFERFNVNGLVRYELSEKVEFYAETKFFQTNARDADGIPFNDDIPIALDNPFIPAPLRAQLDDLIAQGIDPQITMSRDILDRNAIPTSDTSRTTYRFVTGFRGDLTDNLSYDASFNFGRTEVDTQNRNSRVEDRFFAGVDAVLDPETGQIVCRSDLDETATPPTSPFPSSREGFLTFDPGPDSGCVPINLFGEDSITPEMVSWAWLTDQEKTRIDQRQVLITLTGDTTDFVELPGGPIGFALGFEYREEESRFNPGSLEQAGLLWNTLNEAASPVSGSYDVTEGFAEVLLPLLSDLPFAERLEVTGSFRYSDYSNAGGVETYGTGVLWQPVSDLRLRGTYNRSVRAPNIFELFSPPQVAFIGVTADPCNPQNIGAGTEFRQQNCLALVGAGFDAANFLSARVAGTTGGNANLDPEKSDSWTLGAVLTPSFAPDLSLSVDFYSIKIKGAIDSLTGTRIAELCVDLPDLNNSFCDQIQRNPNNGNAISSFTSGNVNLSKFSTEGIDFQLAYSMNLEEMFGSQLGTLDHGIVATYVFNNREFPDQNDPEQVFENVGEFAFPEFALNYNLTWTLDDLSVGYQVRYQSSQLNTGIENEDIDGDEPFADPLKTGDAFIHDITASYALSDQVRFRAGINNLGNRKPFLAAVTRPIDAIGRTFFFNISGSF